LSDRYNMHRVEVLPITRCGIAVVIFTVIEKDCVKETETDLLSLWYNPAEKTL